MELGYETKVGSGLVATTKLKFNGNISLRWSQKAQANGKPSNADSQRDVEYSDKALANDYANNFMIYIMYGQRRLQQTPDNYLRSNPGKASPGQIYQILFNLKQGNLNNNDIPK
jgi:hypothetical protein